MNKIITGALCALFVLMSVTAEARDVAIGDRFLSLSGGMNTASADGYSKLQKDADNDAKADGADFACTGDFSSHGIAEMSYRHFLENIGFGINIGSYTASASSVMFNSGRTDRYEHDVAVTYFDIMLLSRTVSENTMLSVGLGISQGSVAYERKSTINGAVTSETEDFSTSGVVFEVEADYFLNEWVYIGAKIKAMDLLTEATDEVEETKDYGTSAAMVLLGISF